MDYLELDYNDFYFLKNKQERINILEKFIQIKLDENIKEMSIQTKNYDNIKNYDEFKNL